MMLGMAYQLGYIPLKLETIEKAIRRIVRHEFERNIRAFHIGRKIVIKPDHFIVHTAREVESARQALRRKTNTLQAVFAWPMKRRGENIARQFRVLMRQTLRATRGLQVDDQLMRDVVIRAFDCVIWGGIDYARQYCHRLVDVFQKDDPARNYAITRAVVWNLAKVMLIKDEPYVAAMLTSPEKYKKDMRRYNVNPARGDRLTYRHHNRPEFVIMGRKFRFEWKSRDWQLRLAARCTFLRKILPGWHEKEKAFRNWYMDLIDRAQWVRPEQYDSWLAALSTPETVTGYREVRYPKQETAKAKAEAILAGVEHAGGPPSSNVVVSLSNQILSHR
jgi:indolepyruvate ferredoxin oxidoreductase